MSDNVLLSVAEMYEADRLAEAGGVPSLELMEAAGAAIARHIQHRWRPEPVAVLCGPGNNGGDGFGAAVSLARARWPVRVALLGDRDRLEGDAAVMAGRWGGPTAALAPEVLDGAALVVDALFGAGLQRPLDGAARATLEAVAARGLDSVAVDVPSGVHGDTGAVLGAAARAAATVTFFRPKPGHLLLPGRELCGRLVVSDIGIPASVLDDLQPRQWVNGPGLWVGRYPWPGPESHKYARGHAVVAGGGAETTGAARLAATAALRVGAGLVTVAAPRPAVATYAGQLTSVMVRGIDVDKDFTELLTDRRKNAVLIGPGSGVTETTRAQALATLGAAKPCVLDADALTVFAARPRDLFDAIQAPTVLTPHDGEYARLFAAAGDRLTRARAAARESGAVILLKGSDSVIAAPDGRAAININGPPALATAGSGDVLAGLVLGLLAQGVGAFDAACMAAWLHGEAARATGAGLISEQLADAMPAVLGRLQGLPGAAP